VPTGKCSDQRPVNIGNHFVAVNPYYALTYERKKSEVQRSTPLSLEFDQQRPIRRVRD
jgi:hypothetical protein